MLACVPRPDTGSAQSIATTPSPKDVMSRRYRPWFTVGDASRVALLTRPCWLLDASIEEGDRMSFVMGMDQHRAQISAEWIDTTTGQISRARVAPGRGELEPGKDRGRRVLRYRPRPGVDVLCGVGQLGRVADQHVADRVESRNLRGVLVVEGLSEIADLGAGSPALTPRSSRA